MAAILRALRLNRCDLVDAPANPKAQVVLYKRAPVEKDAPGIGAVHTNRPDWLDKEAEHFRTRQRKLESAKEQDMPKKSMKQKLTDLLKSAGALVDWAEQEEAEPEHAKMAAFHEKLGKAIDTYGDGAGLAADHPLHALKALHKDISDYMASCEMQKSADEVPPVETPAPVEVPAPVEAPAPVPVPVETPAPVEDVEKSVISKREIELTKKLEEAQKELNDEREASSLAGQKEILKSLKGVAVNLDTDAAIFKSLKDTNESAYKRVLELLNAADAAVTKSGVLTENIGSPLAGDKTSGQTAWAKIEAEAALIVAKGDKKITKQKAINIVMEQRPELVKQYQAEVEGK